MKYLGFYESKIGELALVQEEDSLVGLWFEGQKYCKKMSEGEADYLVENTELIKETKAWLDVYFSGREPDFMPKLKLTGTDFRRAVGEIMLRIPYGETITYGDIAKEIAKQRGISRMSSQAVGGAVGHNPLAIIVPCHRVVGANGSLTGYGGGMERKITLLELEGVDLKESGLYVPKKGTAL